MRVLFGVGSMMARMEGKKQPLAHVRRKDVLPRLRNGDAICGRGQWFCLDLCGFGCFSRVGFFGDLEKFRALERLALTK
jgi:hypothetical protein